MRCALHRKVRSRFQLGRSGTSSMYISYPWLDLKPWRHPMGITLWGPGTILLSLSILSGLAVGPSIAYSQSAGMAGSGRTSSGESHGTATKPKNSKPGPSRPGTQPSDMPGQTVGPRERAQALEERLRSGQRDQPSAQDQISNRLEQMHGGSAAGTSDETIKPSIK